MLPTANNLSARPISHYCGPWLSAQKGGQSSVPTAAVLKALSQESPQEVKAADI